MILHPYSHGDFRVANYYGHGFGSVFAKLFSKIAAKTAAKSALSVAKNVGKKVLKTAIKTGTTVAKEVAKEGLQEGTKSVQELATQGITNLAQKALNKGLPPEAVHNISNIVQAGAHTLIDTANTTANRGIDHISSKVLKEPTVRKRKKKNTRHSSAKRLKFVNAIDRL